MIINELRKKMENYIEKRYREEAQKFWANDEWMSGGWGMGSGFAITNYMQNRPHLREVFIQEYLKKSEKSS